MYEIEFGGFVVGLCFGVGVVDCGIGFDVVLLGDCVVGVE